MMLTILLLVEICWPLAQVEARLSPSAPAKILLDHESFHPYFTRFVDQEHAFLHDEPTLQWDWFLQNIPWLDVPDKTLEEIYYFRWYSFQKHIRQSPEGLVIDEFLDNVPWAGKYNTINAASPHHLREARWLRNPDYADQYSRFWFSQSGKPRRYSFPAADAIYSVFLATGNKTLPVSLLSDLVRNYEAWEKTHRDDNGLFWQIDDRDGMEYSIGGSGYRPTINSYMYGDAVAISKIAATAGDTALSQEYAEKAQQLRHLIEMHLWNPAAQFYETVPRGQNTTWVNVRELVGYVPWYFDLPRPDRAIAWKQLNDPEGFSGKYGPTTAERRSPRFRFAVDHECLWNGPSWPFATTQTLVALANLLNGPPQNVIGKDQYFALLSTYAQSQHIKLPNGTSIPWIDEDLDPDTGQWIARNILEEKKQPPPNRGRYYNHSGFADLIITGLIGIRPSPTNVLTIHPLIPAGKWQYFALDSLPYHGHLLTIYYDATGKRYQRGPGFHVLCDGHEIASRHELTTLTVNLPRNQFSARMDTHRGDHNAE
jgi:hypothetical protein